MPSLIEFLRWKPLAVGSPATGLSLTADDGTWIKLQDFKGNLHVLLVFFRSLDEGTGAWLRGLDAERSRFEALDCAVFGVNTARTDTLRAWRTGLGVETFLLYDPLALAARGYRASGRVTPACRDQVVLVGKDGTVRLTERGLPKVDRLLDIVATVEGRDPPPAPTPAAAPHATGDGQLRTPGAPAATVREVVSQDALALLKEADSPYLLVDVRTLKEFRSLRSPVARHIPLDELPHRYQELGQTTHLIFVCQGGGRSASAAEFMTSIGATHVVNVLGGMSEWSGEKVSGS
ncbi:MAG: redoxin domain-containing protein [Myxococcales bacterium]|nr:redoxin domain-containing protein [Myxococcales bacterium]